MNLAQAGHCSQKLKNKGEGYFVVMEQANDDKRHLLLTLNCAQWIIPRISLFNWQQYLDERHFTVQYIRNKESREVLLLWGILLLDY